MRDIKLKPRLITLFIIGGLFTLTYLSLFTSSKNKEVVILFRYDDYSTESSDSAENEVISMIDQKPISCTFGIIPYSFDSITASVIPLSQLKIQKIYNLASAKKIEIAQHGYLHEALFQSSNTKSEFKGQSLRNQYNKIIKGKRLLDSVFHKNTVTFIPPWNSYDTNTLKVLSELQFKSISSDNLGDIDKTMTLNFVPFTATPIEVERLMKYKKLPFENRRAIIVLMIHEYDFEGIGANKEHYSFEKFNLLMDKMIDENWKVCSIQDALQQGDSFNNFQYRINRTKLVLMDHLTLLFKKMAVFQKLEILSSFYTSWVVLIKITFLVILYYIFWIILISIPFSILLSLNVISIRFIKYLTIGCFALLVASLILFIADDLMIGKYEAIVLALLIGTIASAIKILRTDPKGKNNLVSDK